MNITAYDIAKRFVGFEDVIGPHSNPAVLAMLQIVDKTVKDDDTPWCSAFVNYIAWLLGLERSNSLAARSWLKIGQVIDLPEAVCGFDVVIMKRPANVLKPEAEPGAEVIAARGHVGFFGGLSGGGQRVYLLGGNQSGGKMVSLESFPISWLLGVRRLRPGN